MTNRFSIELNKDEIELLEDAAEKLNSNRKKTAELILSAILNEDPQKLRLLKAIGSAITIKNQEDKI